MTVSGDRVSLTNVWPEQNDRPDPRPEDKTPVTGSYIDYTTRQAYRRAELPNGQVISAVTLPSNSAKASRKRAKENT